MKEDFKYWTTLSPENKLAFVMAIVIVVLSWTVLQLYTAKETFRDNAETERIKALTECLDARLEQYRQISKEYDPGQKENEELKSEIRDLIKYLKAH